MGKGKSSPRNCLEWSLVSGRRSIFSDRQDFVHKLEFEISKGKKKKPKAKGTFACVEMTALVTLPWDFWCLSCNWASCFPNSSLGKMVVG